MQQLNEPLEGEFDGIGVVFNMATDTVIVLNVIPQGPSDKAGIKAGDRIISIDNTEVAQKTDLGTLMQEHSAGDTLSITVARDGQMQTVSLTLGEKNAANSGNGTNGASRQEKSAESAPQQNPQG